MSLGELYDDLQNHITDDQPSDGDGFVVDSLERADWAVRKIAQNRRRLAQALEVAQAERARIDAWEMDQRDRADSASAYFLDLLERFHRQQLEDDPKAKTIRLPAGELVARKQPDVLVVDGGEDTVAWAEEHAPNLVVVKKSIDKVAARSRLGMSDVEKPEGFEAIDPATGEVVAGCWFKPGDVKFTVKTDGAA